MADISLDTQMGNFKFTNPILNAAGVRDADSTQLNTIINSWAGGVVTKSATMKPREGNPEPRMKGLPHGCINSMGLPNHGIDYYLDYAIKNEGKNNKQVILSIAGLSIDENIQLLKKIQDSDYQGLVEMNLSCPNIDGETQIAYDFDSVEAILNQAFEFFTKPLGIKLPPYLDFYQFDSIAKVLNKYPITYVNAINTIGNGLVVNPETEQTLIKPKGGFGGISGEYIKPTALANVRALRLRLNPEIKIIGTGGIHTGEDVFEHILCGADAVQIGTYFGFDDTPVFEKVTKELLAIMARKGYTSLDDFRGKLKVLD